MRAFQSAFDSFIRFIICLFMILHNGHASAQSEGEVCSQAIDPLLAQADEANDGLILAMVGAAAVLAATTRGNDELSAQAPPATTPVQAQPAKIVAQPDKNSTPTPAQPGTDRVQAGFDVPPSRSGADDRRTPGHDRVIAQPDTEKRLLSHDQLQAGFGGSASSGGSLGSGGSHGSLGGSGGAIGNDQLTYSTATVEGQSKTNLLPQLDIGAGSGGGGGYDSSQMPGMADQTRLAALSIARDPSAETGVSHDNSVAKKFGPNLFRINTLVLEKFCRRKRC